MLALGGSLASSVAEASHLVTDRICRTVKFLCALGRGIPILSLDWLYQVRGQEIVADQWRKWREEEGCRKTRVNERKPSFKNTCEPPVNARLWY